MRAMDSPVAAPPHEAGPELEDQILVRPTPADRTEPDHQLVFCLLCIILLPGKVTVK
jgi:hypothetical protein